ncbi:hypothetical protein F7725_012158 [Dissostichus mawsoni]|uniref:PACS1 n=1 Tax=Dissostichus mawsoni TaxID=36200 RepID=A0A7J5YLL5_DISMA|nr:hypothetical protein F7725_012158 [Dissostichus mawsoni]
MKRDVNRLHVMLQRRKRYKNRTLLGYKTLAMGVINMAEVMQHPMDGAHILVLHDDLKDAPMRAALSVHALCSQPIGPEDIGGSDDAVPPQDLYDDDEDFQGKLKKSRKKLVRTTSLTQQSIFKQRFVSLLRRFKVPDEVLNSDPVGGGPEAAEDLDLLYDSLQGCDPSDSGPEFDDSDIIMISPKPKLRPFFDGVSHSSSRSEIRTQKQQTEMEIPATQGPRLPSEIREEERAPCKTRCQLSRHSWGASMKDRQNHSSMDSETSTDCRIPPPQERIPDSIILINTSDWQGQVAVAGDQSYLSTVLCCFVEQMASKTPDWLNYVRFLILPIGAHPLAKFLASLDSRFSSLFMDPDWRDLFGRVESPALDPVGVAGRVSQYLSGAAVSHLCPISEAMLTCKHKRYPPVRTRAQTRPHDSCTVRGLSRSNTVDFIPDDDYCQKFVPFIGVVKVGIVEQNLRSISRTPHLSSIHSCYHVDYWSQGGGGGGGGRGGREVGMKNSLKSNFRCLQVSRISGGGELLSLTVVTREKNKRVMFLSKKTREKEAESRSQLIEGISRLICTSKHQHTLRGTHSHTHTHTNTHTVNDFLSVSVSVDGVEWRDVRFFQLAAQWPTHVKHFPVGVFSKP